MRTAPGGRARARRAAPEPPGAGARLPAGGSRGTGAAVGGPGAPRPRPQAVAGRDGALSVSREGTSRGRLRAWARCRPCPRPAEAHLALTGDSGRLFHRPESPCLCGRF